MIQYVGEKLTPEATETSEIHFGSKFPSQTIKNRGLENSNVGNNKAITRTTKTIT